MAGNRKDWEAIEREYRTGRYSNRELAREFEVAESTLRNRAKNENWTKDLTSQVKTRVREKLLRKDCAASPPKTDTEIIEEAAATQVEVVRSHHKRIGQGTQVVDMLMGQLFLAAGSREELEEAVEQETAEDSNIQRRNAMLKAISLPQQASTALNLTTALKTLIGLDRQAFGLDDKQEDSDMLKDLRSVVDFIDGKTRGLPNGNGRS